MSKQQRETIDQMLWQPRPEGPQTVAAMRAGFAAMMATMIVSDQIRTTTVTLGVRPALLVEPTDGLRPGTILYFHGGGNVFGSHLLGNELQFLEADEGVIAYGLVGSGSAHVVALNLADTTRPTPSSGTIVAATQPLAQGAPSPDTLEPGAGFVVSVAGDAQQLPDTNRKVHAPARPPIGTALQGYDGRGQRAS